MSEFYEDASSLSSSSNEEQLAETQQGKEREQITHPQSKEGQENEDINEMAKPKNNQNKNR